KSTIWARPSTYSTPNGCCIKALAAKMKYADTTEPATASHNTVRCTLGRTRPQPNNQIPIKTDSKKNAMRAYMANGAPNTSPTKREYSLQAIPNWNSWTKPVATPMMKLIMKILPQNLVIRRYCSLPVLCQAVCIATKTMPKPMVSGTIKKW